MPKTTLTIVAPNVSGDPQDVNSKYMFTPEATVTFHSELISVVHPYYNDREKKWEGNYSVITFSNVLNPIIVKASVSAITAIMENKPYAPVSDGSGGSTSGGSGFSGSGTGGSGSTAYTSTTQQTFNSACLGTANQTYYHNGSGTLPAAGNQVFSDSAKTTLLNDGYYGIDPTGTAPQKIIRVTAGYVASGWPLDCLEHQIDYPTNDPIE